MGIVVSSFLVARGLNSRGQAGRRVQALVPVTVRVVRKPRVRRESITFRVRALSVFLRTGRPLNLSVMPIVEVPITLSRRFIRLNFAILA